MLRVYVAVTAMSNLNFSEARIQLPSNLHFKEWEALVEFSADALTVDYLMFGFPAGYEGPIQSQSETVCGKAGVWTVSTNDNFFILSSDL